MSSRGAFVLTMLMLAATFIIGTRLLVGAKNSALALPLDTLRPGIGDWYGIPDAGPDREIRQGLRATSTLSRIYRNGKNEIGLFVAFYASQQAGHNVHSPKACLPGNGWVIWDNEEISIPTRQGSVPANKYVIENDGRRLLVIYWYQSRRRIVSNELWDKVHLIGDALAGGDTSESLVRVVAVDGPGAQQMVVRFAGELIPELGHCIGSLPERKVLGAAPQRAVRSVE